MRVVTAAIDRVGYPCELPVKVARNLDVLTGGLMLAEYSSRACAMTSREAGFRRRCTGRPGRGPPRRDERASTIASREVIRELARLMVGWEVLYVSASSC